MHACDPEPQKTLCHPEPRRRRRTFPVASVEDRQSCLSMREPDRQDCLSSTTLTGDVHATV
jgi:hypothetical protein